MLNVPILMLVFNRLETTVRVFEQVRKARPRHLYIVADGARAHKAGEGQKCEAVRRLFLDKIDWPCELHTLFRTENLGCRKSVSTGITWFFEQVEEGIILEDDCLPDLSFFSFCAEMLDKYRDNKQIMHISGSQLLAKQYETQPDAYLYARVPYIWGWATWRRAWQLYDAEMEAWPKFLSTRIGEIDGLGGFLKKKFLKNMQAVHRYELDTWDYQWTFTLWQNRGISIVPNRNLISNIGFGADATHTATVSHLANQETSTIGQNIAPANAFPPNFNYDKQSFLYMYGANILIRGWRWFKTKFFK